MLFMGLTANITDLIDNFKGLAQVTVFFIRLNRSEHPYFFAIRTFFQNENKSREI